MYPYRKIQLIFTKLITNFTSLENILIILKKIHPEKRQFNSILFYFIFCRLTYFCLANYSVVTILNKSLID